jgi:hypothetical protein
MLPEVAETLGHLHIIERETTLKGIASKNVLGNLFSFL